MKYRENNTVIIVGKPPEARWPVVVSAIAVLFAPALGVLSGKKVKKAPSENYCAPCRGSYDDFLKMKSSAGLVREQKKVKAKREMNQASPTHFLRRHVRGRTPLPIHTYGKMAARERIFNHTHRVKPKRRVGTRCPRVKVAPKGRRGMAEGSKN